jgi:hypothetical protein
VPVSRTPTLASFNGIGTTLYGRSDEDPTTNSYATTQWLTIFWLPVFPLARYRVVHTGYKQHWTGLASSGLWSLIGRLPLRTFDLTVAIAGWAALLAWIRWSYS